MLSPTDELIQLWKQKFGPIYQVEEFIFRAATLQEAGYIFLSKNSSAEKEEHLVKCAVLWPENFEVDDAPAGIVSAIAEEIRNVSGLGDPKVAKNILEDCRTKNAGNIFTLIKAIIIAAMPMCSEEELENLTFPKLLEKVAMAEEVMRVQQAIMAGGEIMLDLIDPEEQAAMEQQTAAHKNAMRKPGQAVHGDPIAQKLKQAFQ